MPVVDIPEQIKIYLAKKGYLIGSKEIGDVLNIDQSYAKRCLRRLAENGQISSEEFNSTHIYYRTKTLHSCSTPQDIYSTLIALGMRCNRLRTKNTKLTNEDFKNMVSFLIEAANKLNSFIEDSEDDTWNEDNEDE